MKKLIPILLALMLLVSCGEPVDINTEEGAKTLEKSIEEALFDYHRESYEEGDADGVGFVVMGREVKEGKIYAYTINMYGVYEEKDGAMCKVDGHSCIPMVVVMDEKDLSVESVIEPVDGEGYFDSVMELFPEEYRTRIFDLSIEDYTAITAMEAEHISAYLEDEGKEMVIKQ